MIRKLETQDQNGNKVYRYTTSDIVLDLDTGRSVKQDIDTLMSALGISGKNSNVQVSIDASTLQTHPASDFVLKSTYTAYTKSVAEEINLKAPLDSPGFAGTPTVPDVPADDYTGKIANTKYVDNAVSTLKEYVVNALKKYASTTHSHSASQITSGTFSATDVYAKNSSVGYNISRIRNIKIVSESEGVPSSIDAGSIVFVYGND